MIGGIGVDTIETARVKKQMAVDAGFKAAIFTADEIAYCDSKHDSAPFYAARFAAKEAFLKAIGTGLRDGISLSDIEIQRDPMGRPSLKLHRRAAEVVSEAANIQVSLSHVNEVATAIVVIER